MKKINPKSLLANLNEINRVLLALRRLTKQRKRVPRGILAEFLSGAVILAQNPEFDPVLEFSVRLGLISIRKIGVSITSLGTEFLAENHSEIYELQRSRGYDKDQTSIEFDEKLIKAVSTAKCMIFISSYENDLYNSSLTERNGWTRQSLRATTKGNNGKSFEREEVVWFNAAYEKAVASGRVPLHFSAKESRNKKVNPAR